MPLALPEIGATDCGAGGVGVGVAGGGVVGMVGGGVVLLGGVVAYVAIARFKTFNPLPDESVQALKENVQWIANRK